MHDFVPASNRFLTKFYLVCPHSMVHVHWSANSILHPIYCCVVKWPRIFGKVSPHIMSKWDYAFYLFANIRCLSLKIIVPIFGNKMRTNNCSFKLTNLEVGQGGFCNSFKKCLVVLHLNYFCSVLPEVGW